MEEKYGSIKALFGKIIASRFFLLDSLSAPSRIMLSLAIMLLAGFLVTRITKKVRLPNVTGYIFAGLLIGPYVLHLIPESVFRNMGFITDIALAFIAFGVGKFFRIKVLKRTGMKVVVITLMESLIAALSVSLAMIFFFHLPLSFSLLIGAIASATAPASTIMTIQQYQAKGKWVNTLLQVVALDDVVSLLAFSVCAVMVSAPGNGSSSGVSTVILPIVYNIAVIGGGCILGYVLQKITGKSRSAYHRLVLLSAFLFLITGICDALNISPLLSCMAMGMVFINASGNKKIFKQANQFTPVIYLLFFVLSGMNLNVPALASAGLIGLVYFVVRIAGKYAGAFLGAVVTKSNGRIRKYLGVALIPQAGVSIGLAMLAQRILPNETGIILSTIILSSGILYELVGPASAKWALKQSGSFKKADKQRQGH